MSLESLTRHCRGTVTSMALTLSCLLLLSLTNLPYQALTMMSPADRRGQGGGPWHPPPQRGPAIHLTHSGLFGLDYSSDRFLHQSDLRRARTVPSGPLGAPPLVRAVAKSPRPHLPGTLPRPQPLGISGHVTTHSGGKRGQYPLLLLKDPVSTLEGDGTCSRDRDHWAQDAAKAMKRPNDP